MSSYRYILSQTLDNPKGDDAYMLLGLTQGAVQMLQEVQSQAGRLGLDFANSQADCRVSIGMSMQLAAVAVTCMIPPDVEEAYPWLLETGLALLPEDFSLGHIFKQPFCAWETKKEWWEVETFRIRISARGYDTGEETFSENLDGIVKMLAKNFDAPAVMLDGSTGELQLV